MNKKLTKQEKILKKSGVLIWEGNYIPELTEFTSLGYVPLYLSAIGDSLGGLRVFALVWSLERGSVPRHIKRIAKKVGRKWGDALQMEIIVQ